MEEIIAKFFHALLMFAPLFILLFKRQIREFFAARNHETEIQTAPIQEIPIKAIDNPFSITLNHIKSNAKDGICLQEIKSKLERMNILIAWNVNIQKFYSEFEKDITSVLYDNEYKFLSDVSSKVQYKEVNSSQYKDEIYFEIPKECQNLSNPIGEMKKTYPSVLVLYRENISDITPNDIVCTVWIIHLKDHQMKTRILHNYSKCMNNRIITMNEIYNSDEENLCVACQVEKSNIVLLQCTHNCVCTECFKRIGNKCPVCRTIIQSHFEMKD